MLSEAQLAQLEGVVQGVNPELHIEEATLEAQQTLTLVLCNDALCFRPLQITTQDVDIAAVLAGQPEAQRALQERLRVVLQDVLSA